jgi:HEAT repeat protein
MLRSGHEKRPHQASLMVSRKRIPRLLFIGLISLAALLVVSVALILCSLWVEDRFPTDDSKRVLLPGPQKLITKPIVNALRRQVENYARRRAEALYMKTGLTLDETIARFLDDRVDLIQRRIYAYRLARIGSPQCVDALLKVLQSAPSEHKAFMAQLIGSTGNPAAKSWLLPLIDDADPSVVMAAISGLSVIGGEDVTALSNGILKDAQYPESLRIQAALGLATIGTPAARGALIESLATQPSTKLSVQLLNSLGQFEFREVADTFTQYLSAPETPRAMRVVAIEALANSSSEAVPFLLQMAETDRDPDVRASSAWAISAHDTVDDLGEVLADLVEREHVADVRRRLYEALLPQATIPADLLLTKVLAEDDIAARVAGFNVLGRAVNQQPGSQTATVFDNEVVPKLLQIATSPNSLNIQMRAVFALRRAQTEAARTALQAIAQNARPQVAAAARNGLPQQKI